MSVHYTSIYSDMDGVSHFRDVEIDFGETVIGPGIPALKTTAPFPTDTGYFLAFQPGISIDWHPAPRRLFHFFLAGQCEVTTADGEIRTFGAGDIVLAEDTTGKGHITRNPGTDETRMAVVAIRE